MDRCCKILSWPWDGLDPLRCSMKMQVFRIVFPICVKAMLDGTLEREIARDGDAKGPRQDARHGSSVMPRSSFLFSLLGPS
jgi:hypothetical protein